MIAVGWYGELDCSLLFAWKLDTDVQFIPLERHEQYFSSGDERRIIQFRQSGYQIAVAVAIYFCQSSIIIFYSRLSINSPSQSHRSTQSPKIKL
jgi:hypothetical protein